MVIPHSPSDRPYRSKKVHIHRVFAQTRRLRDFENLEIFDKPKKEHRFLPVGKVCRGIPDGLNLLVDQGSLFR
jgi:hypothetical protein